MNIKQLLKEATRLINQSEFTDANKNRLKDILSKMNKIIELWHLDWHYISF